MSRRELQLQKRVLVCVVLALSCVSLASCEISRNSDPLANLTDAEIEQLEQEIRNLPEGSVILKVLERYI